MVNSNHAKKTHQIKIKHKTSIKQMEEESPSCLLSDIYMGNSNPHENLPISIVCKINKQTKQNKK